MTDLGAIVARDAEPGWPARTAKAQAQAAFQALEDRRALLDLLRETRDLIDSINSCHGCLDNSGSADDHLLVERLAALDTEVPA